MRPDVHVVWTKPCTSAMPKHIQKPGSPHRPTMQRLTTISTDCEEKRYPHQGAAKPIPYLPALKPLPD